MKNSKYLLLYFILNSYLLNRKCNTNLLKSYGLHGIEISENRKSNLCPQVKYNCCTKKDEEIIIQKWNYKKIYYENQYKDYLNMIKYLWGFYFNIKDYLISSNMNDIRKEFNKLNLNQGKLNEIIKTIKNQIINISKVRTESYCNICSNDAYNLLFDMDNKLDIVSFNIKNNKNIYLNKDFCRFLIDKTSKSNFVYIKYIIPYLKIVSKILHNKFNLNISNVVKENKDLNEIINNCYLIKGNNYFFFCEKLCETFNIMSWSNNFDGNIKEIKSYYILIRNNINKLIDKSTLKINKKLKKSIDKNLNNKIKTKFAKKINYEYNVKSLDQYIPVYINKNGFYLKLDGNNLLKINIRARIINILLIPLIIIKII